MPGGQGCCKAYSVVLPVVLLLVAFGAWVVEVVRGLLFRPVTRRRVFTSVLCGLVLVSSCGTHNGELYSRIAWAIRSGRAHLRGSVVSHLNAGAIPPSRARPRDRVALETNHSRQARCTISSHLAALLEPDQALSTILRLNRASRTEYTAWTQNSGPLCM